jgi:RHH-type proline utilization regulon transcriptional repressor/proline dehydrogenase/delta 1-pyrroline-5-carboxylate dehydrogenase
VAPLMRFADNVDGSRFRGEQSGTVDDRSGGDALFESSVSAEHVRSLRVALADLRDASAFDPGEHRRTVEAIDSYLYWMKEEFGRAHDPFRLLGEDNFRRYLPVTPLVIRLYEQDSTFEIFARAAAARAAGCRAVISAPPSLSNSARRAFHLLDKLTDCWAAAIEFVDESDDAVIDSMRSGAARRVRFAHPSRAPEIIRRASAESYCYIADAPVLADGRVELLWYFQEQCISNVYHRYGNLGRRTGETRAEIL